MILDLLIRASVFIVKSVNIRDRSSADQILQFYTWTVSRVFQTMQIRGKTSKQKLVSNVSCIIYVLRITGFFHSTSFQRHF